MSMGRRAFLGSAFGVAATTGIDGASAPILFASRRLSRGAGRLPATRMNCGCLNRAEIPMLDEVLKSAMPSLVERLEQIVVAQRLPGLAVAIVDDQQLAWFRGFGMTDVGTKAAPQEQTIFRVASITKTFTAGCILQLRDAGKLSLDDPLTAHIPEYKSVQPRADGVAGVTLRRLLCHRAGIETEAPLPCWDALEFPSREELLKSFPRMEIVIPQDSAFKYSNLAYGLLGEVVHRVSGQPFFDYLKGSVLDPLGMADSTFDITPENRPRMATGYLPNLFSDGWAAAPEVRLNGLSACGQLHSSPRDLAKWISLQFRMDDGGKVLCQETLQEMHRPVYMEPDWSVGYCLGWRAVRSGDEVYHGHGGGIHGFASQILFSKTHKLGVICLANVWPHPGLLPTSVEVLNRLIDVRKKPPVPAAPRKSEAAPAEVQPLLGHWVANPGIPLIVAWRDGAVRFEKSPLSEYSLHAPAVLQADGEAGRYRVREGRGAGERVLFEQGRGGEPARFLLGGFVYRKVRPTI